MKKFVVFDNINPDTKKRWSVAIDIYSIEAVTHIEDDYKIRVMTANSEYELFMDQQTFLKKVEDEFQQIADAEEKIRTEHSNLLWRIKGIDALSELNKPAALREAKKLMGMGEDEEMDDDEIDDNRHIFEEGEIG